MKNFLGKAAGVIVGIIAALFGTATANVAVNTPDLGGKKKPLYLEQGKFIKDKTLLAFEGHLSHISHDSSAKTQSSQTDKGQKVAPVEDKAKAVTKTQTDKAQKTLPVVDKAKAATQTQTDAAKKTQAVENKAKATENR